MRITKLLIRITQYLSNSNRAQSEISYLVGHHPAPVASPVGLWPGHSLCTHHVLLPDAEIMTLQQHVFLQRKNYNWQNTAEPNINARENTEHQNQNVASSRKRNRNHAITWDIYSHLRAARSYEDMHTYSMYCKSTLLNNTTKNDLLEHCNCANLLLDSQSYNVLTYLLSSFCKVLLYNV